MGCIVGLVLACAACGTPPEEIALPERGVPALHHTHLNSVDPAAAAEWYAQMWPEGRVGEFAGHVAFVADIPVLFNQVDTPPPGAWDSELQRAAPQSAFWHIGGFTNTTGVYEDLAERGFMVLPLFTGPGDRSGVHRSGLTPYNGIQTAAQLDQAEDVGPRDGGFGYLEGPDGALVELTGGPNTTRSFSHVHLFHEEPGCAARWYVEVMGMSPPPRRNLDTGESEPGELPEPCQAERGEPGWPSLEHQGTVRAPRGGVVHGNGSISFYPRQCTVDRCDTNQPLVPSRGQVLDHVGFAVESLDAWLPHLAAHDVVITDGPYDFGSGRAVLIEGPDGLSIELVEVGS